jgi:predicted RNA-binding Zn-ribbon protein involved in translation (DUF1610 family)
MSIVRENLLNEEGYVPYCGNIDAYAVGRCHMPRTRFDGKQFVCPTCGWHSEFPNDFIAEYKKKWGLK